MNLGALQGPGTRRDDINAPFNLNIGDSEVGMTFLHHLFSNFDQGPDKAANLFRKMNSLHLRRRGVTMTPTRSKEAMNGPLSRLAGRVSPNFQKGLHRSRMKSD